MTDTEVLVFMLALGSGGIFASIKSFITRKLRRKTGFSIELVDGRQFTIDNATSTFSNEDLIAIQKLSAKYALPEIELSKDMTSVIDSFVSSRQSQDKIRALYISNTVVAMESGLLSFLMNANYKAEQFSHKLESINKQDFEASLNELWNCTESNADAIPNFMDQRSTFYRYCPPDHGEFIVAWADKVIATSHRLIILSKGDEPKIVVQVPINNIKRLVPDIPDEKDVSGLMANYSSKTTQELELLLQQMEGNVEFRPESVEAIKRLLKSRN